jgi:hypothetical protein
LSGTPTTASPSIEFTQNTSPVGNIAAGDVLETHGEFFLTDGASGYQSLSLHTKIVHTTNTQILSEDGGVGSIVQALGIPEE